MIDEETKAAILRKAAGGPKAKQIANSFPAWRVPGPHRKRTPKERRKRKAQRKQAKKARRQNRR